jgi:uncharacterized protein (TIGR03546 family)
MPLLPWSPLRKVLKIFKSSLTPGQVALGFALGAFAGLPPGGLHLLLPTSLAFLFRTSFSAFLLSWGLFELLALPLAPGSYAIGRALLESEPLYGFWRTFTHLPLLAPMGYSRYLLLGSYLLALGLAVPAFFLVRHLVAHYRHSFAPWVAGWELSRRLRGRRWVRFLQWLFLGGEAKYEARSPRRGPFRFLRREALVVLPVLYGICYLLAALIVPFFAGRIATSAASLLIGGQVAVESSSFSLFTGELTLWGLSVQDPGRPEENVLVIPTLTLDAGMLALLEKRVVFNRVRIDEVRLHVVREEDGTLNVDGFTQGWDVEGYLAWAAQYADKVDWLTLIKKFGEHLLTPRPRRPRPDLSRYAGGRSFPPFEPTFAIEELEVGRVYLTLEDRFQGGQLPRLTALELEIENLALPARLNSRPVAVRLRGEFEERAGAFSLSAVFREGEVPPTRSYSLEAAELDLPRLGALYGSSLPVEVLAGEATLSAEISVTGGEVAGQVSLVLTGLVLALAEGETLFGLSPELSQATVEGLNRYAAELPIVIGFAVGGPADSPTLGWERPLLEVARQGLMMAGRRELSGAIQELGQRLELLGPGEEVQLPQEYAQLKEQVEQAAARLIQGAAGQAAPPELQDALRGLLEKLFPPEEEEQGE